VRVPTAAGEMTFSPRFSPDGSRIVYSIANVARRAPSSTASASQSLHARAGEP